jgi:uncharacterized membrane protein YhhN
VAVLLLLSALATSVAVVGKMGGPISLHYIGKPLILPPLVVTVAVFPSVLPASAQLMLAIALVFAWLGDIALMLPGRGFIAGLASFLVAHVAYLVCFSFESPWRSTQLVWLLPVLPLLYLGLRGVLARVGRLKVPIVVYATALALVTWRLLVRFERWEQVGVLSWALGCAGAGLFVLADSLLVRRRFAEARVPYWLELGAYAASQLCIVSATIGSDRLLPLQ